MKYTLTALFTLFVLVASAQIPQTLSFQGFLTDGNGDPITGNRNFDFEIRRSTDNGVEWNETQTNVAVTDGLYNVQLGSVTPFSFAFDQGYVLEITVNDETLTPTIPLTSSAFALGALSVFGDSNVFPSGGSVGVGTASPEHLLDIRGAGADDGVIFNISNDDESSFLKLFPGRSSDPDPFIGWDDNAALRFATWDDPTNSAFTEVMRVTSGGNVGIGTTNPTSRLHIVSESGGSNAFLSTVKDDAFSSLVLFRGNGSFSTTNNVLSGDLLGTVSFSGQTGQAFATSAAIVAEAEEDFGTSMGTGIKFYTDRAGDGTVDISTPRMTIANYGWVGIGTETPSAELDIRGSDDGGGINARIQNTDPNGWAGLNLRNDNKSYSLSIGGSTAGTAPDNLYIFNGTSGNAPFVVAASDNVGVGIESPVTTLHVDHGVNGPDVDGLSISRLGADRWTFLSAMSDSNLEVYYNNVLKGEFDTGSGTYFSASDRRLKRNISPASSYLTKALSIPIKEFHYKDQKDLEHKEIGVVAQELLPLFPSLVNSKSEFMTVSYIGLGPIAIKAIQEQQEIIDKLKRELADSRAENVKLESKVEELSSSINHIEEVLNIKPGSASKAKNK